MEDEQAARQWIAASDRSPSVLYVRGPHNSGKTAKFLPGLWNAAREEGYAGLYLMHTALETCIADQYYCTSFCFVADATGAPTAKGTLSLLDYARFATATAAAIATENDRYFFGDYTKLALFFDIPAAPSPNFEVAIAALYKLLLVPRPDKVVKLVGLMTDDSQFILPGMLRLIPSESYTMPAGEPWVATAQSRKLKPQAEAQSRKLETQADELALQAECIAELKARRTVVCFFAGPSLVQPNDSFFQALLDAAVRQLPEEYVGAFRGRPSNPPGRQQLICQNVKADRVMDEADVLWRAGPKLLRMEWTGTNRFQFGLYTGLVLMGDPGANLPQPYLDPATGLFITRSSSISRDELATQAGFADSALNTEVIHIQDLGTPRAVPEKREGSAYGWHIGTTILRMIEMFPGYTYHQMPINWAETSEKAVQGTMLRLSEMGLTERYKDGHELTQIGRAALAVLPIVKHDLNAACLAASAIADPDIPAAARRVILRLAAVAAHPDMVAVPPDNQAAPATLLSRLAHSYWGPGRQHHHFGGLWVALGLWDLARLSSADFERLEETPEALSPGGGLVVLEEAECRNILDALRKLENTAGLQPTDDARAYELDGNGLYAVRKHLIFAFFDRLCQIGTKPGRGAAVFQLVVQVWLDEDTESLVPLEILRLGKIPGLPGVPGPLLFYAGLFIGRAGKYFFWNATVVAESAEELLGEAAFSVTW